MKASAVYRKAAEVFANKREGSCPHTCDWLWIVGDLCNLEYKEMFREPTSKHYEWLHEQMGLPTGKIDEGNEMHEQLRPMRVLMLLLMSEIAKDSE